MTPHCTKTTKNAFIVKNAQKCKIKLEYSASGEHETNF